jgi:uncharacterized RDD family membrane protein YckC
MNSENPGVLVIRTPEGVSFPLRLAGPFRRMAAWCIDLVFMYVVMMAIAYFLQILMIASADAAQAMLMLLVFAVQVGYGMIFEWFNGGRTPGKQAMRLRVMDAEGLRLTGWQVVVRNLMRAADMLPLCYAVGGASLLLSRQQQRLGDLAAGTIVIHEPKRAEPRMNQVLGGKYNSFRRYPHLEARLRQACPPSLAALALEAVQRRDDFDAPERLRLFGQVAAGLREFAAFPEEAITGLADEQYVRNCVDSLHRTRHE